MKRLAIDMDGVIADVTTALLNSHEQETGISLTPEEIYGLNEYVAFPNIKRWLDTEGYFRHLPVMLDSQRVVKRLMDHYDIFIVSAATEFPQSLTDKMLWLQDHFPFIGWQKVCLCGSKTIVKADILIDDHFKNLDYFDGQTFLYTATHNILADTGRHQRVNSWLEIEQILL
jgi:5'(3')-deoxyribonucleotidase